MTNNKKPDAKKPGEKEPGTYHYNPGNMSGKGASDSKDKEKVADRLQSREELEKRD